MLAHPALGSWLRPCNYIFFRPDCNDLEKLHQYSVMLLHHSLDSFFTDCHLEDEKDPGGFQNLVGTSLYDRITSPPPSPNTDWKGWSYLPKLGENQSQCPKRPGTHGKAKSKDTNITDVVPRYIYSVTKPTFYDFYKITELIYLAT